MRAVRDVRVGGRRVESDALSRLFFLFRAANRKSHTTDPFHKCHFCNRTFTNMTKYLYHRRSHLHHDTSQAPPPVSAVTQQPFVMIVSQKNICSAIFQKPLHRSKFLYFYIYLYLYTQK